jgi:putative transposase
MINSLAKPEIAPQIKASLKYYQQLQQWWVIYTLAMPDHFHGIFMFGKNFEMKQIIHNWKRYLARYAKIEWQKDFFDHRIRSTESLDEKIEYIRQNPVRKNLVTKPEDWLYAWTSNDLN